MTCDKCGKQMVKVFVENGDGVYTEIWRCTNLRCLYMARQVTFK